MALFQNCRCDRCGTSVPLRERTIIRFPRHTGRPPFDLCDGCREDWLLGQLHLGPMADAADDGLKSLKSSGNQASDSALFAVLSSVANGEPLTPATARLEHAAAS